MPKLAADLRLRLAVALNTDLLANPIEPDAILGLLDSIGGAPSHQYRADTVTLSGGTVERIRNRRGADALVLAAGTLAAPAPDALFGGAPSLVFGGTQWLDSNLPASAWRFLHDGTGCEVFTIFAPTSLAAIRVLWSTLNARPGSQNYLNTNGSWGATTDNASANIAGLTSAASAVVVNTPTYLDWAYGENLPLEYQIFAKEASAGVGTTSLTPAATDAATFRLGAQTPTNNFPAHMRWCETLIFPRVLHEYERQIVREYIQARYGIAAPSLTGADREIMSLLPFSYLDAAYYAQSGGLVTAFGDRARPGHSLTQGSSGFQVAVPTADSGINNQLAATFVNASNTRYVSSLVATSWRFMHGNGNGSEFRLLYNPAQNGRFTFGTRGSSGAGMQLSQQTLALQYDGYRSAALGFSSGVVGSSSLSAWHVAGGCNSSSGSPQWEVRLDGSVVGSGAYSNTPENVDSVASLTIGANSSGQFPFDGKIGGLVIFDRVLTAPERARLQSAIFAKWGIAA